MWIHLLFGQKGKNVSDETRALIRKRMNEEWSEEQIQASQIAGLQSMINGWTINIQMLEAKIEEIKTKIDNKDSDKGSKTDIKENLLISNSVLF